MTSRKSRPAFAAMMVLMMMDDWIEPIVVAGDQDDTSDYGDAGGGQCIGEGVE